MSMRRFEDLIRGASRKELEAIAADLYCSKIAWKGVADVQHMRGGKCIYREEEHNALALEGANYMLGVFFNAVAAPAQTAWYEALYTVTPGTSYTGAGAATNELSGATGYARIQITTWTLSQVTNWRVTTPQVTFTAGGTWAAVQGIGFVNAASGAGTKGLSAIALSAPRTLLINDQLLITYYIQLS